MCLSLGISQIHPSPLCSSLDTPFLPPLPWLHHLGPEGKLVLSSNIPSRGAAWGLPMSADPRAGLRAGSRSSGAGTTLLPSADLLGPSAGILVRCSHQMGSCGSKLTTKAKVAHLLPRFHTGYEYQDESCCSIPACPSRGSYISHCSNDCSLAVNFLHLVSCFYLLSFPQ